MGKEKKKCTFRVLENETIDQCLDRIKKEGYIPIRRIEKPIFKEIQKGNEKEYVPVKREIVFEAVKTE